MTNKMKFTGYVGTYTKGDSKGIYSFTLDTVAGKITEINVAAELDNPTYLNISEDNQYLYAVVKKGEEGGVAGFSINSQTFELTPINTQVMAGSPPCHVSLDRGRQFLFSANYHKGTVESYTLSQENGLISPPVSVIHHEGSGPDPRQEKTHTHFAGLTPDEKYLAVVELGSDKLISYQVGTDGKLTEASRLSVAPGSGPRHLAFHPNKKFAYMMTEFSSEIIALEYHAEDGSFIQIQAIKTIPEDFTENNQGSAIHLSSDGRFVYAGNRGHNTIAIFAVNIETGELTFVERVSTEGDWPRDFVLDPTEAFLIASNQNSSNLVVYSRDKETGKLTLLQADVTVPDPVCVKFLHVK